jgi:Domain of unknown function (DUF4129)
VTTNYLKYIWLLLLSFWLLLPAHAAVTFAPDSAMIKPRQFSKPEINDYKKSRAFRYKEDSAPEDGGIMSLISYYLDRFFNRLFGSHVGGTSVWTIITYVLMIFGVIMIIFQFFKVSPQGLLRRSAAPLLAESMDADNIHEIDFDKLIQQAAAQQNYRLAVRFWYLRMLKMLSDRELIHWQISKTNYDYYYELKQPELRSNFLMLTRTFEDSWYGNHELSGDVYEAASSSFQSFFTSLRHL